MRVLHREQEKLKAARGPPDEIVTALNLIVAELSLKLESIIKENNETQDFKRKLQASVSQIEAPLQIAQECLGHRELRDS